MFISQCRLILLIILASYASSTYGMERKNNALSAKRFIVGLCATTLGALSLYDQLHNEKYSWKRSFFTGSCLLTGLISLFGKCNVAGFKVTPPTTTSFTRTETSYQQGDHWVTFVTQEGDIPQTNEDQPSEAPFDLSSLRQYEPYLRDMRPTRPTQPQRPHAFIPPMSPIMPMSPVAPFAPFFTFDNNGEEQYTRRTRRHRQTIPGNFSISCTLF